MFDTGKKIQTLNQSVDTLREQLQAQHQGDAEARQNLLQGLDTLQASVRKHDMAIGDMLDTWEEWREDQAKQTEALTSALHDRLAAEAEALRARESDLVGALIAACDQFFILRLAAESASDKAWQRQLFLAESAVTQKALRTGLQVTGAVGAAFSYDLHEPAEKVETDRPDQHMTIARVFSRGYLFHGRLQRKAQVAVYTLTDTGTQPINS